MNFLIVLAFMILTSLSAKADANVHPVYTIVNANASTNIGTGAYVQLDSAMNARCDQIEVHNTSGSPLFLAIGAASSEQDIPFTFAPGYLGSEPINVNIQKGVRLSAKSASGTANSGFLIVNCLQ